MENGLEAYTTQITMRSDEPLQSRPLVSVIVATYRRDDHLGKAVLSLLAQTYKPVEIIVVDDNADDAWNKRVGSIIGNIEKNIHTPIIYIKNEANQGSAETRNIGIRAAKGDYITFLDDDDIYLPEKIEKQITHMLEKESDFSITDLNLFDENNKLIERRVRSYLQSNYKEQLFKYHLLYHMTGTDTMMFKKSYLQMIGGFSKIDVGDEFYLMQCAIEKGGEFSYMPGCDVKAYVHSETDSISSGESKIKGENALYEHKKQYFELLTPDEVRYIRMRHYAVIAFAFLRMKRIASFAASAIYSFISAPVACVGLLMDITQAKRGAM